MHAWRRILGVGATLALTLSTIALIVPASTAVALPQPSAPAGNALHVAAAATAFSPVPQPANFEVSPPGSMGGYYTYSQVLAELDQMAAFRPDLITVRQSLGTTFEGNSIYMVKISDNPSVDEPEPEVFYNSLIHAREPQSMAQNIFYMWHLLEEYDNDPAIKDLVDNTEMYFVPVINVDGYLHNEATNPNGGGLWRKNRRLNAGGSYGVDLNRNFGFQWGFDNSGSSSIPTSSTYRGTAPFSELETQALRDFILSRDFGIAVNYHAAAGQILYPARYNDAVGDADPKFSVVAAAMSEQNGYSFGPTVNAANTANGVMSDWEFGSAGVYGVTPEVGPVGGGFWPAPNRIVELSQEWVEANKMAARMSGVWAEASLLPSPSVQPGAPGQVNFSLTPLGVVDGTFVVTATALTPNVTATCAPLTYTNPAYNQEVAGACSFDVSGSAVIGDPVRLELAVHNGMYDIHSFEAEFVVGDPSFESVLEANFDAGPDGFEYSDDLFRFTAQPAYASGQWVPDGGYNNGGLNVAIGGLNNEDVSAMAGGWARDFVLAQESDVTVTLRFDLRQQGTEEFNEVGQALLSIDGVLSGASPYDFLAQIAGDGNTGPPITTGWQQVAVDVGTLGAGAHTIGIGGYMSLKTLSNESTTVVFDEVLVQAAPTPPNMAPTALVAATPISGDTPLTVSFDGSGSTDDDGTLVSHVWDFGDDGSSTEVSPSYTYVSPGTFDATLTVTDDDGETSIDTITISVSDPPPNQDPVAAAVASPDSGNAPVLVAFDASSSSDVDGTIVSYVWDFGDFSSGSGVSVSHIYDIVGTYTATLTVVDDEGATDTTTLLIRVIDPDAISIFVADFDTSEDGFGYADDSFRATSLPQYASGVWDVAGGFDGGALRVALGGQDDVDVLGMSGGWTGTFTLVDAADVTVSLRYDLRQEGTEEADEPGQALMSVNGVLVGISPNDYIDEITGDGNLGPPITTGWQHVSLDVGELPAGTHTITLGGYFAKKTFPDETTTIVFDDLAITGIPIAPPIVALRALEADEPTSEEDDEAPVEQGDEPAGDAPRDAAFGSPVDVLGEDGEPKLYVFVSPGVFPATVPDDDEMALAEPGAAVTPVPDPD